MKRCAILLVLVLLCFPALSRAASPETLQEIEEKIERYDVEEAWRELKGLVAEAPGDGRVLELASQAAFYRGDYAEAYRLIKKALEKEGGEEGRKAFALFIQETIGVVTPLKRYESAHFIVSLDERLDGILADYLIDALEQTYRAMARQYGFEPREKIRFEIFPDAKAFHFASTLSSRDIEVTGAVGLAKFNKVMMLSPRALVYGYRWLDAASHEYMHHLIVKLTANRAPIWFHEGLAKYEETRWRDGPSYLSALYQGLLARGVETGKLIPFEKMEPSLVRLETPEDVQLAYAQAAAAIEFILGRAGSQGLRAIMDRMAKEKSAGAGPAIQEVLGMSFEEFERTWRDDLAARGLKAGEGLHVHRYKIREGKADEEKLERDEIRSLVARNRAHLADLLRERGRMEAALIEYRRALSEASGSVPLLTRLSAVLIDLGRAREALSSLEQAREASPDHPNTYTLMGQAFLGTKEFKAARDAFVAALQINPFHPEAHRGLAAAYAQLGDRAGAAKEQEIVRKLIR